MLRHIYVRSCIRYWNYDIFTLTFSLDCSINQYRYIRSNDTVITLKLPFKRTSYGSLSFNWSPAIIHLVLLNIPPGVLLISPFHVQHYLTLCPTPKNISSRMLLCCLLIIEYLSLKHFHSVTWKMQLYLSHWPWKGTINVNNVAPTAKITTSWRKRKNLKTSSQLNFTGKKSYHTDNTT